MLLHERRLLLLLLLGVRWLLLLHVLLLHVRLLLLLLLSEQPLRGRRLSSRTRILQTTNEQGAASSSGWRQVLRQLHAAFKLSHCPHLFVHLSAQFERLQAVPECN